MGQRHEHLHKYEGFGRVVRSDGTAFDVTYTVDVFRDVLEAPGRPLTPGLKHIVGRVFGLTVEQLWPLQREEVTLVLSDHRKRLAVTLSMAGEIAAAGCLTNE